MTTRTTTSAAAAAILFLAALTMGGDGVGGVSPMIVSSSEDAGVEAPDAFSAEAPPPEVPDVGTAVATSSVAEPPPIPQPHEPADGLAPPEIPVAQIELPRIETMRPQLVVDGVTDSAVLERVEGVAHVAAVERMTVSVVPTDDPLADVSQVVVGAVDLEEFRPLTPQITADEPDVWRRLAAGDGAFIHDVGHRLGTALGGIAALGDPARPVGLRVGAYASNGIPPVADVIVSQARAESLNLSGLVRHYVALQPGVEPASVVSAINALPGASVEVLEEPVARQAYLTGSAAREFFEPFSYIDHGDGMITIDPGWVARNISTEWVPIFSGPVTCHRQFTAQMRGALQELVDLGLDHLIDPSQYGGCWVPRHIDWRADRPLSMHAWGLAMDMNVSTNQLGAIPQLDLRVVEVMDRWGFNWGGRWSRPDGMHFEMGAVLQVDDEQF